MQMLIIGALALVGEEERVERNGQACTEVIRELHFQEVEGVDFLIFDQKLSRVLPNFLSGPLSPP